MEVEEKNKKDDLDKKINEYLKNIGFDLKKYKTENFEFNLKGLSLVDQKGRKIIVYNNTLTDNIEVVYEKLKMTEQEVVDEIKEGLWEDYLMLAEILKETVVVEKPNKEEIQFVRHKINENGNTNEVHRSPIFKENELYDIYEYLMNQVLEMDKRKKERKK